MKIGRRPELVTAANVLDDLWIAAIYQTNLEIAGSPRNIYRYSLPPKTTGGRALDEFRVFIS